MARQPFEPTGGGSTSADDGSEDNSDSDSSGGSSRTTTSSEPIEQSQSGGSDGSSSSQDTSDPSRRDAGRVAPPSTSSSSVSSSESGGADSKDPEPEPDPSETSDDSEDTGDPNRRDAGHVVPPRSTPRDGSGTDGGRGPSDGDDRRQQQEQFDTRVGEDTTERASDSAPSADDDRRQQQERFDDQLEESEPARRERPDTRQSGADIEVVDRGTDPSGDEVTQVRVDGQSFVLSGSLGESEVRDRLLGGAASETDLFDADDFVITGATVSDGEVSTQLEVRQSAQEDAAERAFAEDFDEQFDAFDIGTDDVVVVDTDDGFVGRLRRETEQEIAEERADRQEQAVEAMFQALPEEQQAELVAQRTDLEQDEFIMGEQGEVIPVSDPSDQRTITSTGATPGFVGTGDVFETDTEGAEEDEPAETVDPGPISQALGGGFEAVSETPLGTAASAGASAVFDERDDGTASPAQRAIDGLEPSAEWWRRNISDNVGEGRGASTPGPVTAGDIASSPFFSDASQEAAELLNIPEVAQAGIRAGGATVSAGEFLADSGPEGFAMAGSAARQTPDAAVAAGQFVRENPRQTAVTGTAIVGTGVFGGVAARGVRGAGSVAARGSSVAARGASGGVRRVDNVLDVSTASAGARSRAAGARERSPDISVRRDADAPRLEIDPMLQQQIRGVASSVPDQPVRTAAGGAANRARDAGRGLQQGALVGAARAEGVARDVVRATPTTSRGVRDAATRTQERLSSRIGDTITRAELAARSTGRNDGTVRDAIRAAPTSRQGVRQAAGRTQERLASRIGQTITRAELAARTAGRSDSDSMLGVFDRDLSFSAGFSDLAPSRPNVSGRLSAARDSARLAARAGVAPVQERLDRIPTTTGQARAASSRSQSRLSDRIGETLTRAELSVRVTDPEDGFASGLFSSRRSVLDQDINFDTGITETAERAADAVSGVSSLARDGTIRIGPMRPRRSRTTLDADDVELQPGLFPDDAELPRGGNTDTTGGSAGGASTGTSQTGSGQLTSLQRRFDDDTRSRTTTRPPGTDTRSRQATMAGTAAGVASAGATLGSGDRLTAGSRSVENDTGAILGATPTIGDTGPAFDVTPTAGVEETLGTNNIGTTRTPPATDIMQPTSTAFDIPTATTTEIPGQTTQVTGQQAPPQRPPPRIPRGDLPGFGSGDTSSRGDSEQSQNTYEFEFRNPLTGRTDNGGEESFPAGFSGGGEPSLPGFDDSNDDSGGLFL